MKYNDFKTAFMAAIDEYNQFGQSNFSSRCRVDDTTASQLYGFRAPSLDRLLFCKLCRQGISKGVHFVRHGVLRPVLNPRWASRRRPGCSWRNISISSSSRTQERGTSARWNPTYPNLTFQSWSVSCRYHIVILLLLHCCSLCPRNPVSFIEPGAAR